MFQKGQVGLFVCSLNKKQTIKPVSPDVLKEMLEEGWELGDLYRVGDPLLGGWPW